MILFSIQSTLNNLKHPETAKCFKLSKLQRITTHTQITSFSLFSTRSKLLICVCLYWWTHIIVTRPVMMLNTVSVSGGLGIESDGSYAQALTQFHCPKVDHRYAMLLEKENKRDKGQTQIAFCPPSSLSPDISFVILVQLACSIAFSCIIITPC